MSRIYWDAMLFVYWLEDHPVEARRVGQIHATMASRGDALCTSVFTIGEVLTGVYRQGTADRVQAIREWLQPPHVEILPFTADTADLYARIRGRHRIAPADAVHLASAAAVGVNLFLTNDRRLHKLLLPGIDFIAGLDVNLF